jgi:hypothetical protein
MTRTIAMLYAVATLLLSASHASGADRAISQGDHIDARFSERIPAVTTLP